MDAGAHVFMEKPIATNIEDAEKVVAQAREKRKKLVLGYILRVHPSWVKFIEVGQNLGKPLVMRLNLNQQSSGEAWHWHKNLIDSLIPIVDCSVHYVDAYKNFSRKDEILGMEDEPDHQELCDREQEFLLRIVLAAEQSIEEGRAVDVV